MGCSPWGREESDTTERLYFHFSLSCTGEPPPVFLPGESQGWGSLVGCRLWGRTESGTNEATWQWQQQRSKCTACLLWYKHRPVFHTLLSKFFTLQSSLSNIYSKYLMFQTRNSTKNNMTNNCVPSSQGMKVCRDCPVGPAARRLTPKAGGTGSNPCSGN